MNGKEHYQEGERLLALAVENRVTAGGLVATLQLTLADVHFAAAQAWATGKAAGFEYDGPTE